jgi:hypothetical protein
MGRARRQLVAVLLALPLGAAAAPLQGALAPPVAVEDTAGARHDVPDPRLPVLVIYEDQKAASQNPRARALVGKVTDNPVNKGKLLLMAVADLEKWNWWPARRYALKELQSVAKKEDTTLYCDWKGTVRRAWGLTKGKSGFVLVAPDGRVRFFGEGPLDDTRVQELAARLAELGLTL